ncbi:Glycosylphosphatidylinositol (GPI) anchor assembly protein [Elasticomyces elasticus]|nr:Glycosylphosphatidylinositol (GPI) anchor assembly protein [Elasticomyces elasticus]
MSAIGTATKAAKQQQASAPISHLDSDVAKIFTHLQPVLVLTSYYLQFRFLVADPVTTLLTSTVPLSILQTAYVVICLPPTGSSNVASTPKPGQKRKAAKVDAGLGAKIVPALLSLILAVFLGTPVLAIILVLFGAPLTTHQPHTLLCAAHMSLLASIPLIYVHGVHSGRWREIVSLDSPIDEVFGAAVGTLLGAWFGAVPIPLDWYALRECLGKG